MNQGLSTCRNTCIQTKSGKLDFYIYIHSSPLFLEKIWVFVCLFFVCLFWFLYVCVSVSLLHNSYLHVCITGRGRPEMEANEAKISPLKPNFKARYPPKYSFFKNYINMQGQALNHLPSHYNDTRCCRWIFWSKKMKKGNIG